jgi:transcriptional regulator with XRE-family HTH domain
VNEKEEAMTDLGRRLREVRELRELSLRAAAAKAEISPPHFQKIERGEVKQPSPAVLHRLSSALAIPYRDLMELAGHVVPRAGRGDASVNILAHALNAEDLTAAEVEELARYLSWYRHERSREG